MSVSTIKAVWTKSDATREAEDLDLAIDLFRAEADRAITVARGDLRRAQRAYTKTLEAARIDPNFDKIVTARLDVKAAELTLKEAVALRSELFTVESE
jgi:hypothetical protein